MNWSDLKDVMDEGVHDNIKVIVEEDDGYVEVFGERFSRNELIYQEQQVYQRLHKYTKRALPIIYKCQRLLYVIIPDECKEMVRLQNGRLGLLITIKDSRWLGQETSHGKFYVTKIE